LRAPFDISAWRLTTHWRSPSRWTSEVLGQSRLALPTPSGRHRAKIGSPTPIGCTSNNLLIVTTRFECTLRR
jgi:hypothetical protein